MIKACFIILMSFEASASVYTLKQIQEMALEKSLIIRQKVIQAEAESLKTEATGLLPNPSFVAQIGSTTQAGLVGPTYDYTLNQTIPFPGKLGASRKLQEIKASIAQVSLEESKNWIQHGVTLAAVRLGHLTEISKHSMERKRRFQLISDYLKSHPQASPSQRIEAMLITNQIRILEKSILELERDVQLARSDLGFFLLTDQMIEVRVDPIETAEMPDLKDIESEVLKLNYQLKVKELEIESAETSLSKAKKELLPDFTIGANYRAENIPLQNLFYSGFIGLTLPLWDHGQRAVPAARAQLEAESIQQSLLRQSVTKEFKQNYLKTQTAYDEMKKFPLAIVKNTNSHFDEVEKEFRRGRIGTSILLQSDAQIHETLDLVYQLQIQFLQNLSALNLMARRPLRW